MMNQRELETRIKALHKAQAAGEPAANIISHLESLKKEDVPTEEMLRVSYLSYPYSYLIIPQLHSETCLYLHKAARPSKYI